MSVDVRLTMPLGGTVRFGGSAAIRESASMSASVRAAVRPMATLSGSMLESRGVENMQ